MARQEQTMDVKNLDDMPAFTTKDGAAVDRARKLVLPETGKTDWNAVRHALREDSVVLAKLHLPNLQSMHSEEIYYITAGAGRMRIGKEIRDVKPGDAVGIPPGTRHKIWNTGKGALKFLCCCAPGYEHGDTVITET